MKINLSLNPSAWAFISGIAYVLCFPKFNLAFLAPIFMVCIIVSIRDTQSYRMMLMNSLSISIVIGIGGFSWIVHVARGFAHMSWVSSIFILFAFSLIAAPQIILFYLFGFHFKSIEKKISLWLRPLFWASAYIGIEFLSRPLKMFPENIGNPWVHYTSLAQCAALGGVSMLGFLPCWLGASLACAEQKSSSYNFVTTIPSSLAILSIFFWGQIREARISSLPSNTIHVGIVQSNLLSINNSQPDPLNSINATINELVEDSTQLALKSPKPDLILWPETAYPLDFPTQDLSIDPRLKTFADRIALFTKSFHVPLLFGSYELIHQVEYNSAILLNADGHVANSYRKVHLLAFGEYIPLRSIFPQMIQLDQDTGNFARGLKPKLISITLNGRKISMGPSICYEDILSIHQRTLADLGADVFVNISKDSWFGNTSEPWQHFDLSAIQAIEFGIPIIRATNTGLSGTILPSGKIMILSPPMQKVLSIVDVPISTTPIHTLYAKFGDWFAWLCVFLMGIPFMTVPAVGIKFTGHKSRRKQI